MKSRPPVTVKEVAERAGVSQMTVSRVLNQPAIVRAPTRERVERAIRDLNYRPNLMARGLAGGGSYYIGLLYFNPSRSYLSEILIGAIGECRRSGHHLVVEEVAVNSESFARDSLEDRLRVSGLDGVVIMPPLSESRDVIAAVHSIGMAYVLIAPRDVNGRHPMVKIDDVAGAKAMTTFLLDKGHRRIGFVKGEHTHISSELRYRGFTEALKERDIAIDKTLVESGAYTLESGLAAGHALLARKSPPTAIFASNDDMAAGVIAAAHERGVKVPEALSVAGFDDTTIASAIWPQLTTIRQPIAEMATRSVEMLATLLDEKPRAKKRLELKFELIARRSVGPPSRT